MSAHRGRASPRHAGLTFSTDNRCFVSGAMVHLMLSGAWLLWHATLLPQDGTRVGGLQIFAIGFLLSLIYGLAAHMLPRFTGNPIVMGNWPWLQFAALHCGVFLLVGGALGRIGAAALAGAVLVWISLAIFAWRAWGVLWPASASTEQK